MSDSRLGPRERIDPHVMDGARWRCLRIPTIRMYHRELCLMCGIPVHTTDPRRPITVLSPSPSVSSTTWSTKTGKSPNHPGLVRLNDTNLACLQLLLTRALSSTRLSDSWRDQHRSYPSRAYRRHKRDSTDPTQSLIPPSNADTSFSSG